MNYLNIAGHLGADPEVRFTAGGQKVTTLRVACRSRKDDTIWYKVTIWGDQFDRIMTYFKKGSSIIVSGELMKPEIFTDREGNPQISLQVVAHHLAFSPFGKGKSQDGSSSSEGHSGGFGGFEQTSGGPGSSSNAPVSGGFDDEEIPF